MLSILRLSLEGRICLYLRPPNFSAEEDEWKSHPYVREITANQALEGTPKMEIDECKMSTDGEELESTSDVSENDSDDQAAGPSYTNKFALLNDDE